MSAQEVPGECFADLAYSYFYRLAEDRWSPSAEIRLDAEAEWAEPGLTTIRLLNALELNWKDLKERIGVNRLCYRNREANGI